MGQLDNFCTRFHTDPLFDIAGMAAGILKYPAWKFLLVGAAGRLPNIYSFPIWGTGAYIYFPNRI